jgi:hypothetical protein
MSSYSKLGTLSIRFMAVGFFVLAFVSLFFGFAGPMAMGSMMTEPAMTGAAQQMPGGYGTMMRGGMAFWWGPTLGNIVIGAVLYGLSKSIGRAMGAGLDVSA